MQGPSSIEESRENACQSYIANIKLSECVCAKDIIRRKQTKYPGKLNLKVKTEKKFISHLTKPLQGKWRPLVKVEKSYKIEKSA